jgi:hypothetical protein
MGAGLACSFCGLVRTGGVAGPTTGIYICRDCIQLARHLVESDEPPEIGDAHPPSAG